ncbi:hypothetical protein AMK17_19550 [Streptomyces sp. CB00072]|uniref:hypothetical protein n=1 Tax=Streptomyces sp. CB00072 TaxID=1703928 RepID=UPI0009593447|nr:hypothetical protein [Streptomyces sp. CB00072]OKI55273.1 hypothetical protein AMK17_19550 [Streptomyces sp. CB00072]
MTEESPKGQESVQIVSIDLGFGGVRARADGRTGLAAWRTICREHPGMAKAAALYLVAFAVLVVLVVNAAAGLGGLM